MLVNLAVQHFVADVLPHGKGWLVKFMLVNLAVQHFVADIIPHRKGWLIKFINSILLI
jgi:hypothetical protein